MKNIIGLFIGLLMGSQAFGNSLHDNSSELCFILYSVNQHKIVKQYESANQCHARLAPDSTFKIALSLMAFDQHVIQQDTVFKWDGKKYDFPAWNQDQTPKSWLKNSTVWVSQVITPKLGYARIQKYLADFHYGNQDFSGDPGKNNGLDYAWLSSSLRISAVEQLKFLQAMMSRRLSVNHSALTDTLNNMYQGKLIHGADLYGKTGAGKHGNNEREANPSQLRDGWFVGFVQQGTQQYIFVSNLSDKTPPSPTDKLYGSAVLKPMTLKLLNEYF